MNVLAREISAWEPSVKTWGYHEPPEEGVVVMDFRLLYRGRLPAETNRPRTEEKHQIRQYFHPQLVELWEQHPYLRFTKNLQRPMGGVVINPDPRIGPVIQTAGMSTRPLLEKIADDFQRCGHRFIPLIRKETGATCALEILFLRRDAPGGLVVQGGDIDNRLKVLCQQSPKNVVF